MEKVAKAEPPVEGIAPLRPKLSQREMIEQMTSALVMENIQLRRTLWLVIRHWGGKTTIDETKCHPLWVLKKRRPEAGQLELYADTMPDPTGEQISALVELLNGSMTPMAEALQKTTLAEYNPAHMELLISNRLRRAENGYWVEVLS